jgi:hypothetical protein
MALRKAKPEDINAIAALKNSFNRPSCAWSRILLLNGQLLGKLT